jgi:hypothetical protein
VRHGGARQPGQDLGAQAPYVLLRRREVARALEEEGEAGDAGAFADNQTPPPDEQARGQLLRALASDAIRGALQRHFGVRLAFQNCHRVAVFPLDASVDETLARFTSVRSQLLNQSPEFRDC